MSRSPITSTARGIAFVAAFGVLAGCDDTGKFNMKSILQPAGNIEEPSSEAAATRSIERDVEAPDVFQVTEAGLWDGRPSLGGVWVAHPDVTDPERVMIRNPANGKSVVGALFRREREIPGPRLQISSDAAEELGMLAGAPQQLSVVAMRREVVEETPPEIIEQTDVVAAPDDISQTSLDPIASAAAAIDKVDPAPAAAAAAAPKPAVEPVAKPAPRKVSSLTKPFLQIGIFSVEANANRTANLMRSAGMVPIVKAQEANGKPFWRVLVGPASNSSERATLLNKIKEQGFTDAYAVTN